MRQFITSNKELAHEVGVTKEYFSAMKSTFSASEALVQRLNEITGIHPIYWVSPKRRNNLNKALKAFFAKQKIAKGLNHGTTGTRNETTE